MRPLGLLLFALVNGCVAPAPDILRPAASVDVVGTWKLSSVDNHPISPTALTIGFKSDGRTSGTLLCNSFEGGYQVVAGRLTFRTLNQTLLGCEGRGFAQLRRAAEPFLHAQDAPITVGSTGLFVSVGQRTYALTRIGS